MPSRVAQDSFGARAAATDRICEVRWLGSLSYGEALVLQEELVRARAAGEIPDQLLLLEHPHVLTLGRAGRSEHVLVDRERLAALGVEIFETGRGGDVTYHGPGQLVAYPILDLAPDRCDLHRYVRDLEKVLQRTLEDCGVRSRTIPGRTGVWVDREGRPEAKVAAIGVRVARWITSHGIALNVTTDLSYFGLIVPCGLAGSAVTSLAELLDGAAAGASHTSPAGSSAAGSAAVRSAPAPRGIEIEAVARRFAARFGGVFDRRMSGWGSPSTAPQVEIEAGHG